MAGINKVILIGNLGKDPEVRHLEGGTSVATVTIATSENYKDREGNRQTQTEWHNLVLWRHLADIAEKYLRKGSKIYVEGKLTHRSYEKDGMTRYITEIVVRDLQMLDSRSEGSATGGYQPPSASDEPAWASKPNTTAEPMAATAPVSAPSTAATTESSSLESNDDPDDLPF